MKIAIILSVFGFLTSIVTLILTIRTLKLRKKSESDLIELMKINKVAIKEQVGKIEEFQKLHEQSKEKILSFEEFNKLNDIIVELTNKLEKKERDQILEGLNQKSFNSKLDYIDKLLIQSGSSETNIFTSK